MNDIILSADSLSDIYEIELDKLPNQTFTININEAEYTISFRTFLSDETFISIDKDGENLINLCNIKTGLNLTHISKEKDIAFFFASTRDQEPARPYSYSDFGENIRFYYGIISASV